MKKEEILKRIYNNDNSYYDEEVDGLKYRIPESVTTEELQYLERIGLAPNNFESFAHDKLIERLSAIRTHPKLTLELVGGLFLKGLTGEFPRGRQPLLSYCYVRHLEKHPFFNPDAHLNPAYVCEVCAIPQNVSIDKTAKLYSCYCGHAGNERTYTFLADLEEAVSFAVPIIEEKDKAKLSELLDFIAAADTQETPGQLEKRIAKARLLPKTDKYMRYGILQGLAGCGILPNDLIAPSFDRFVSFKERIKAGIKVKGSIRSDIALPLAAWRGKNGVDFERAKEIFGV